MNMRESEVLKQLANMLLNAKESGFVTKASLEDSLKAKVQNEKDNARYANLLRMGDYGLRKASVEFNEALRIKLAYQAILPKVLKEDNISNNVAFADVEFTEFGAATIPFRGAPARIEKGPRRIYYHTHTVSTSLDITYDDIFTAAYNMLDEGKDKVAIALGIELDSEFFRVLGAMADQGFYPAIDNLNTMSLSVINTIRGDQMAFDLVTAAIIMNPKKYFDMLNVDATDVDQVTLNQIVETGYVSQLYGVKFIISKLCPVKEAYGITEAKYLGKYVQRQPDQIKIADISWNNKYIITGYANYGIILHNVAAVRRVEFES